jgi:penicillin-insensitive murein endopeptidase
MSALDRSASVLITLMSGVVGACSYTPSPLAPTLLGSVGAPAHGTLSAGVELPPSGVGYRWWNPQGSHYGLPRLVDAVAGAAEAVERERPSGVPLMIGDLSKQSGGRIDRHHSHRTGRDVDLLFFAETPGGEPVPSPGFVKYGADGLAFVPPESGGPRYVRLDVAREWLLVRALVTSVRANVQWLFISAPIEAMLTEYARARGEDLDVLWHAESVMLQPKDSLPHDDHLHLRTACTPDEAVRGCEGGGPYWPWLPELPDAPPQPPDEVLLLALLSPITLDPVELAPSPWVTLPSRDESVRGVESGGHRGSTDPSPRSIRGN